MNNKTAKRLRRIAKAYCAKNDKAVYADAIKAFKQYFNQLPDLIKDQELTNAEYQVGIHGAPNEAIDEVTNAEDDR